MLHTKEQIVSWSKKTVEDQGSAELSWRETFYYGFKASEIMRHMTMCGQVAGLRTFHSYIDELTLFLPKTQGTEIDLWRLFKRVRESIRGGTLAMRLAEPPPPVTPPYLTPELFFEWEQSMGHGRPPLRYGYVVRNIEREIMTSPGGVYRLGMMIGMEMQTAMRRKMIEVTPDFPGFSDTGA